MRFQPGVPFASEKPSVVVDAGLPAGTHRFQLFVVNARGQRSAPVTVDIVVVERPVIRPPIIPVVTPR